MAPYQSPFAQDMIKMQFPPHLGSQLSIAGFNLEADKDGCVTVPRRHVEDLKSHGFTEYVEQAPAPKKR